MSRRWRSWTVARSPSPEADVQPLDQRELPGVPPAAGRRALRPPCRRRALTGIVAAVTAAARTGVQRFQSMPRAVRNSAARSPSVTSSVVAASSRCTRATVRHAARGRSRVEPVRPPLGPRRTASAGTRPHDHGPTPPADISRPSRTAVSARVGRQRSTRVDQSSCRMPWDREAGGCEHRSTRRPGRSLHLLLVRWVSAAARMLHSDVRPSEIGRLVTQPVGQLRHGPVSSFGHLSQSSLPSYPSCRPPADCRT